ncbi:MAG: sulfatase-like hydrolase/transferase [Planctomycetales bacterium]|nr:sulfatase-like hydrolase/transferase [Planctomycetales bacterium]
MRETVYRITQLCGVCVLHARRLIVCVVAAWQLAASAGHVAWAANAPKRPNVLFLLTDDQRADTIGALGNSVVQTPNLDQLARSGFVFENAYCMGSTMGAVCNPSRHMLHSGMSLYRYDPKKRDGSFGDVMRKAGYVTYHLSKKGNTALEYHKAFNYSGYLQDHAERTSGHHGRTAANRAIAFLNDEWDRQQPLFMYLGFAGPHDPRVAAPEWTEKYDRATIPLPANFKPFHPIDNHWMTGRDEALAPWPRTPAIVRQHLHDYYACISSIDHHIGRILQTLRELGEFENTIIVFSSDHGLAIGSHGLFGKQNLYEHSMGSPLIFAGPRIPSGSSASFAYLFDIFPTVCELTQTEVPPGLDGRSLAKIIRGDQQSVRDTVFLAYEDGQRAVHSGDWKLIRYPQVNYSQLFNLREDPDELHNLASEGQHQQKVEEMMALLASEQHAYDDTQQLTSSSPGTAHVEIEFFRQQ